MLCGIRRATPGSMICRSRSDHLQAVHVRERSSDRAVGDQARVDQHPAEAPADRPPVPGLGLEGSLGVAAG